MCSLASNGPKSGNLRERIDSVPREVRGLLQDGIQQIQYFISPYGATTLINMLRGESSVNQAIPTGGSVEPLSCCAGSAVDCLINSSNSTAAGTTADSAAAAAASDTAVVVNNPKKSFYANCGKLGKVVYTVGAVLSAFEFYNSVTKAGELSTKLRRLRDSTDLLKYEGSAKEVFEIALDLQVILSTVFSENQLGRGD